LKKILARKKRSVSELTGMIGGNNRRKTRRKRGKIGKNGGREVVCVTVDIHTLCNGIKAQNRAPTRSREKYKKKNKNKEETQKNNGKKSKMRKRKTTRRRRAKRSGCG